MKRLMTAFDIEHFIHPFHPSMNTCIRLFLAFRRRERWCSSRSKAVQRQ